MRATSRGGCLFSFNIGRRVNIRILPSQSLLLFISFVLLVHCVDSKSDFAKKDGDLSQPASSLCPFGCLCTEQKLKLSQLDQDLSSNDEMEPEALSKTKGKSEILKNGVRVQCQNVKKPNLPELLAENVVQLDLSGNSLSRLSYDDFSSSYSMLQKLIIRNSMVKDVGPGTFSTMKSLKYLDLSNNLLTNFSTSAFPGLENLERIKLNGNPLNCDCHLGDLLTYASSHNVKLQGWCTEPAKLRDRPLTRLVIEELACPTEDPIQIEMKPNTNQIVFEGDPLRLGCRLKTGRAVSVGWLHRPINQTAVTVLSSNVVELTSTSRETDNGAMTVTESLLQIRHLLPKHGGTWTCSWGGRSASVEVTVLSLKTPTCPSQATTSNKGRYSWPRTMATLKVTLPCQANPNVQAFRLCGANGSWEEPDVNSCYYLNEVTKVLEQFAKTNLTFSKTSALESARRLKSYLTDVGSLTDPHEAVFVTQTLHNYLEASGKHPELLPIIMDIYSILVKQEPNVLADSRHGMVSLLQQAPLKTPEFEYQSSGLAVEKCGLVLPPPGKPFAGTCTWRRMPESSGFIKTTSRDNRFEASCSSLSSNASGTIEASVRIPLTPEGTSSTVSSDQQQNIVLSLILSTNPFISTSAKTKTLATPVLGITSGHVTNSINRTVPFVITLRLSRPMKDGERLIGARWNQYTDLWSLEQCQTLKEDLENSFVTFQCCCGFGFFAAFASPIQEEEVTVRNGMNSSLVPFPVQLLHLLPPPVYVGSVVGLLCHLTACLVYFIHGQRLKMTQPTRHALINGWLSLAFLMTAFTLGVRPQWGKLPCQVVGLLLHYLTLSTLLWMVVNASSLYKHVTKSAGRTDSESDSPSLMEEAMAMGHDTPTKPALRFYLIGWGVPLIVVGIAGAIHLEQYYSSTVCFLAKTPALGAVGLPAAILILLILTFHLLSWGYLRHTMRLAAIQKQLSAQALAAGATEELTQDTATERELTTISTRVGPEKQSTPKSGYVPLMGDGDGTSCPSQLTTQVTETSDLASVSSDQERIALLINPVDVSQQAQQRGEAEGAQSASEGAGGSVLHSGRSESERPLLIASESTFSESRLDDGSKLGVDDEGHSNPLMTSFTEDGDSKKMANSSVGALSVTEATHNLSTQPSNPMGPITVSVDDADEKSSLSQLRGQVFFLLLFILTWLSGLCVVTRPFRGVLPYDELLSALSYAIFGAATGLHTIIFHLLTRADVCASCFDPSNQQELKNSPRTDTVAPVAPRNSEPQSGHQNQQHFQSTLPRSINPPLQVDEVDSHTQRHLSNMVESIPYEAMNVSVMDPALLVNSFYDARQSKTARRFFQKQKLLHQMQNNHHHMPHHHHRHHHHRHSRYSSSGGHSINNLPAATIPRSQSHSPITEEALLNASSSSKAKVSNVNIHVEMGAYDWHELQSRLSDSSSWNKSGKQLPARIDYGGSSSRRTAGESSSSRAPSRSEIPHGTQSVPVSNQAQARATLAGASVQNVPKPDKRKRHGVHQRTTKRSKWEGHGTNEGSVRNVNSTGVAKDDKPVYVFVDNNHRERALAPVGSNDETLRTLTTRKGKVMEDSNDEDNAYLKRETSV